MAPRSAELTAVAADASARRVWAHRAVAQTLLALSVCALGYSSLRGRSTEWRRSEQSLSASRKREGMCVRRTTATVNRTAQLPTGICKVWPSALALNHLCSIDAVDYHGVPGASWGHPTIRRRLSRLSIASEHSKVSTACVLLAQKIILYYIVVAARCELGASRAPVGPITLTPVQPSLPVMSLFNVLSM